MSRLYSTLLRYIGLAADLFRISPLFRTLIFLQLGLLVLIGLGSTVISSQKINYTFAQKTTCMGSFVVLPRFQHVKTADEYDVQLKDFSSIRGYPLIAKTVCVTPRTTPTQNSSSKVVLRFLPQIPISKTFFIATSAYPSVQKPLASLSVISVSDPLELQLSSADNTFTYRLNANGAEVKCISANAGKSILCDTASLKLKHATQYEFALIRTFENTTVSTLSKAKIETVTPIKVANTSIKPNATVYDKPHQITVKFDKTIVSTTGVLLKDDSGATVETQTKISGSELTVMFTTELVRGKAYKLTVGSVRSNDGGSLIEPYLLSFTPAKGPKVAGTNIGTSGVSLDKLVRITFDQPVRAQDIKKHITLSSGEFDIAVDGTAVTINPKSKFTKCSRFTINVDSGVSSPYDISGESAWSIASRATCLDVFSIGKSAQGRALTAYRIGSGTNAVLFVGGMHGNEQGGQNIMNDWIAELDANPDKLPINRTIVVIPAINPDGLVRSQRVNANGIDLNRNFPANNWKADVKEPGGAILKNGGGVTALDQPESAALATYTQQLRPSMVMSYHCCGGIAVANDASNSRATADIYSAKTGYRSKNGETIGNFFDYDTTGAYEDWLHDKLNTPLILVELWSNTTNEFSRSKNGLWYIAGNSNF